MIRKLLTHISLILALVTLVFLILYQFNPGIFILPFFQVILLLFCVVTLTTSIVMIVRHRA